MSNLPDIATCSVTASYQTNKATAAGDYLIIKPTEVSLSFMRYIPVKDDRKKFFVWPQREKETRYAVENVPPIQGWSYRPTVVREGYIYVYFETNVDLFKEFKIEALGGLTNIVSDLSEDIRLPQEERSTRYLCLSIDDVVWIAYSEYQFSASYIQKLRSDQTLRERRMQKFDATVWADNRTAPDCYTVDEIDAYFPLADYATPPEKKDAYGSYYLAPGMNMEIEDQIHVQQWVSYFNNVEAIEENPDERDEVFFCLHDPLGCADELTTSLNESWMEMEAIIQSIHTGINKHRIFKYLGTGKNNPIDRKDKDELRQLSCLINSTNMLYQACFSSEEMQDDYGDKLDIERIELILGLKERQEARDEINVRRKWITDFLRTNYYLDVEEEFKANGEIGISYGKQRFASYNVFKWTPIKRDAFLNLPSVNKRYQKNDVGASFVTEIFEKSVKHHELLNTKTILDLSSDPGNWAKFIASAEAVIDLSEEFVKQQPQRVLSIVETLNTTQVQVNGSVVTVFTAERIESIMRRRIPSALTEDLTSINQTLSERFLEVFDGTDDIKIYQIVFTQEFETAVQRNSGVFNKIDGFLGSVKWAQFIQKLAGLNLALSIGGFFDWTKKSKGEKLVALLNCAGGLAGVFEARYLLKGARVGAVSQRTSRFMIGMSIRFSAIGYALGSGVDLTQSIINFSEKDYDAATAYGIASLCGAIAATGLFAAPLVSTGAIAAGSALAVVASPAVIAIAAIGAIGLGLFAAFYLEDNPLEQLVKNCLLNDMGGLFSFKLNEILREIKEGSAAEVVQKHYNYRDYLSGKGFERWADFEALYESVTDVLNGSRIDIRREEVSKTTNSWGTSTTKTYATEIVADIRFSLFIEGISYLEMEAYLVPNGLQPQLIPLDYKIDTSLNTKDKSTIVKRIVIDIPPDYEKSEFPYGYVLFLYRVDIFNNGKYVHPIDKGTKRRYVGARCNINNSTSLIPTGMGAVITPDYEAFNMLFGKHIKIATHHEIINW